MRLVVPNGQNSTSVSIVNLEYAGQGGQTTRRLPQIVFFLTDDYHKCFCAHALQLKTQSRRVQPRSLLFFCTSVA